VSVAAGWPSPLPPSTLAVSSWFSRTPSHGHTHGEPFVYALFAFTSSSGGFRRPGLLTSEQSSLLGLCHRLSADIPLCVNSQMSEPILRHLATKQAVRSVLVVSHHLNGFLRTPSAGLLHPATGQRSDSFPSASPHPRIRRPASGDLLLFPSRSITPLEEFPSSVAVPCHHGRCLPAVFTCHHSRSITEMISRCSVSVSRNRQSQPLETDIHQCRSTSGGL